MKPLGSHKTHNHIAGHQNCGICRPEKKGGRAYENRETKSEVESQMSEDKSLILSPTTWPQWPLLPLINRATRKCGFIVDRPEDRFRIYLGNIWAINKGEDIFALPFEDFISADQIIDNGWVVD